MLIRSKCVKCGETVQTTPTDKQPVCVRCYVPKKKPEIKPGPAPRGAFKYKKGHIR